MDVKIDTKAVGKERPRYSKVFDGFYTPNKTKKFEQLIGYHVARTMNANNEKITLGAVSVHVINYKKVPDSWTSKRKAEAIDGTIKVTVRPDADNILKSILDGAQGVYYLDDKQVVELSFKKTYSVKDSIFIRFDRI